MSMMMMSLDGTFAGQGGRLRHIPRLIMERFAEWSTRHRSPSASAVAAIAAATPGPKSRRHLSEGKGTHQNAFPQEHQEPNSLITTAKQSGSHC